MRTASRIWVVALVIAGAADASTNPYATPDAAISAGMAAYKVGLSFQQSKDYGRAQSYFTDVIQKDQDQRTKHLARIGLARTLIEQKRFGEATEQLNLVLDQADKDIAAEAQYLTGDVMRAQNALQSAVAAYLKIKYLYSSQIDWVVPGIYQAAQCSEELGQLSDARRLYQSIINEYPSAADYVAKAKQRLEALVGK